MCFLILIGEDIHRLGMKLEGKSMDTILANQKNLAGPEILGKMVEIFIQDFVGNKLNEEQFFNPPMAVMMNSKSDSTTAIMVGMLDMLRQTQQELWPKAQFLLDGELITGLSTMLWMALRKKRMGAKPYIQISATRAI